MKNLDAVIEQSLVESLVQNSDRIKKLSDSKQLDFLDMDNITRANNIIKRIIDYYDR